MSTPKTYADAPQEIKEQVAQLIGTYGSDDALLAGALVSHICMVSAAAKAEEREACLALCDDEVELARKFGPHHIPIIVNIAAAIRKRGEA